MICRYCNGTGTSNTCVNGTFKPCAACNGTGEEREEKITNFDRITASPEALAEFIENILDACSGDIDECDVCQLGKHCNPCDGFRKIALNWLNEESEK